MIILIQFVLVLFLGSFIYFAIQFARSKVRSPWVFLLRFTASLCVIVGVLGFGTSALSASGALNWLPPSFAWPTNGYYEAVRLPSGGYAVAITGSGRVHIYDEDMEFVRGWTGMGGGGAFVLALSEESRVFVLTNWGKRKDEYDLFGSLVSSTTYSGEYPPEIASIVHVKLEGNVFLLPFAHPLLGMILMAIGMAFILTMDWNVSSRDRR